jgi:hypothetical protein
MNEITVDALVTYLRDNYTASQPVVLQESSETPDDAVVLTDVLQGIREG